MTFKREMVEEALRKLGVGEQRKWIMPTKPGVDKDTSDEYIRDVNVNEKSPSETEV